MLEGIIQHDGGGAALQRRRAPRDTIRIGDDDGCWNELGEDLRLIIAESAQDDAHAFALLHQAARQPRRDGRLSGPADTQIPHRDGRDQRRPGLAPAPIVPAIPERRHPRIEPSDGPQQQAHPGPTRLAPPPE